ncbi:AAA family ATPase [Candidatus Saccharibacteria bacterium CG_4_10_14_0_2_um_filter_52_9]|nr:MAG: AAA family ATPase [Candidatus Saccharibacteria bacterium CG_4_10_14_0_2_um_filter_52_9]
MIKRAIEDTLKKQSADFRALTITGPRQSGKTTLARRLFPDYRYVSLEDLDMRQFAQDDPRGFLKEYDNRTVIDEVQRVPDLLSYLQTKLDQSSQSAQYILTGSQNFLLSEHIGQTLVGRTSLATLLPLTLDEIGSFHASTNTDIQAAILKGSYPAVYNNGLDPAVFYSSYVSLYLERDVRELRTIDNLPKFQKFITLCAGRAGQLLNMTDLSGAIGVDAKTIDAWIGVLEASFIAYRLQPYAANISKRLTKMPKLYFYDTGILCYLLGIRTRGELVKSHFYGSIFENLIIGELMKHQTNMGDQPRLHFIRDHSGEADCVFQTAAGLAIAEIKVSNTYVSEHTIKLTNFGELLGIPKSRRYLIYSGTTQNRSDVKLVNVSDLQSGIFNYDHV